MPAGARLVRAAVPIALSALVCVRAASGDDAPASASVASAVRERQRCTDGDARACVALAEFYERAPYVPRDPDRVAALLVRACDGGEGLGCLGLWMVRGEVGFPVDASADARPLAGWRAVDRACDAGDPLACLTLAGLYAKGIPGVEAHPAHAMTLASRVARTLQRECGAQPGLSCAQAAAARAFSSPGSTPRADATVLALANRGCDAGEPTACAVLAFVYRGELGVEKDAALSAERGDRAVSLAAAGCRRDQPLACAEVAFAHALGLAGVHAAGMGQTELEATGEALVSTARLLHPRCDAGEMRACVGLAAILFAGEGVLTDEAEAVRLYEQACRAGELRGCLGQARLLEAGKGVSQDAVAAAALYDRACQAGVGGCARLGTLYTYGSGALAKDEARASASWDRGCAGGEAQACSWLGARLEAAGGTADLDRAAALYARACRLEGAASCPAAERLGPLDTRAVAARATLQRRRAQTLRLILPDEPVFEADLAKLITVAQRAGVTAVTATAAAAEGAPYGGYLPVEISARGRFAQVYGFVAAIRRIPRLTTFERLSLEAHPQGGLVMHARVRMHFWRPAAPPAPVALRWRASVPLSVRSSFAREESVFMAKVDTITALQSQGHPLKPILSLEGPVRLDRVDVSKSVRMVGAAARPAAALGRNLERGGYPVLSIDVAPMDDGCEWFEVTTPLAARAEPAEPGAPTESAPETMAEGAPDLTWLFESRAEMCAPPRPGGLPRLVGGPGRGAGSGPLTVRLRDVDAADVFRVLGPLTGQAFIVADDVRERLSLELLGATAEDVLGAVEGEGLHIAAPGGIRRVTRTPGPPRSAGATFTGQPVSLDFKDGRVRDFLRLIADLSGLEVRAPRGDLGRFGMYASEVPWDEAFDAVLGIAGLEYHLEGEIVSVAPTTAWKKADDGRSVSAVELVPLSPDESQRSSGPPGLLDTAARDVELAGVTGRDGAWHACFRHDRTILCTEAAEADAHVRGQFADGFVESVDAGGAVVRREGGPRQRAVVAPLSPRVDITVSPDTTDLPGPLRDDGSVDYVAALNARHGAGIKREDNAAVSLAEAGVLVLEGAVRRRLGLPLARDPSVAWIDSSSWADRLAAGRDPGARDAFYKQRAAAFKGPWRAEEAPPLGEWLRANDSTLAAVAAAVRRPRFWIPLPEDGDARHSFPSLLGLREAAQGLALRATRALGEGQPAAAWPDLMAAHRVAGLLAQGPTLIEGLVAAAIRRLASEATAPTVAAAVSAAVAREWLRDLDALPAARSVEEGLAFEQVWRLHMWTWIHREVRRRGPVAWPVILETLFFPPGLGVGVPYDLSGLPSEHVDWDELLRAIDGRFRAVAAARQAQRLEVQDAGPAEDRPEVALHPPALDALIAAAEGGDPAARQRLGRALAAVGDESPLLGIQISANESETMLALVRMSLAMSVLGRERGSLPATLDELMREWPGAARPALDGHGYAFTMHRAVSTAPTVFALTAVPVTPRVTGVSAFCLDDTGALVVLPAGDTPSVAEGRCPPPPAP